MARTKYTVSFPAAKAGDEVTWPNTVKVYPDANAVQPLGNGYIEAAGGSFIGWSDATSVTFTRAGTDAVTVTSASPTGTGVAASSAASGAVPAAKSTFTTAETPDYEAGTGTYTVMVIPDAGGYAFGVKRQSDAFPFVAVTSVGDWVISDGTYDPTNHPVSWNGIQWNSHGVSLAGGGTGFITLADNAMVIHADNTLGLKLTGLPTVDPHVVDALWNNAGVLTISAG